MMTTADPADHAAPPVITLWSAVSPFGLGRAAFVDGVHVGRRPAVAVDDTDERVPYRQACLVPGFAVREVLGMKNTKSMDRVTGLAVSAIADVLNDEGSTRVVETGPGAALVLGTTMGSVRSMMGFTRASLLAKLPFRVDPALMPNAVMNCAAGQSAIWHDIKGPNATIAGGRAAGVLGLGYALLLLSSRRAEQVLCAAAEEYSPERSWLEYHSRGETGDDAVLGEGCVVVLLEQAGSTSGRRPVAEVLAVASQVAGDGDLSAALVRCAHRVLADAGARADDVWAVARSGDDTPAAKQERRALETLFPDAVMNRVPAAGSLVGDAGAALGGFQIAAILGVAEREPEAAGQLAMVAATDPEGVAACAVLRLAGGGR